MSKPLVSVIIPVYNAREYIAAAIASILKQEVEVEILAIEDCSEESSKDIITSFGDKAVIRYMQNAERMGVAATRNIGIEQAKGTFIAFLDADDWWEEGKLKEQLSLIRLSHAPLVYSGRELVSHEGEPLGKIVRVPQKVSYPRLLKGNVIPSSSVLIRGEIAKEFPQHHDELHEDYIMWLEVLKKYGVAWGIDKPLLKSRMSAGGKSRDKRKSADMHWNVLKLMGISIPRRCYYFVCYAVQGVLKYI
jgi:teichuronic acid biosynthesis glycosyltransferase TuaG